MIELQYYWDNVLLAESEIARFTKSIDLWNKKKAEVNEFLLRKEQEIKSCRVKAKGTESVLSDIENRIKKLQAKKDNLKSEREIEAYQSELDKLIAEKDKFESETLLLMEEIDSAEREFEKLKQEYKETEVQVSSDIELLKNKIASEEKIAAEHRAKFNELSEKLSPQTKARFLKLISSKDGKAIAKLNGEICGHCNFVIPSSLAAEASKGEKIVSCTNCGRFIY